MSEPTREAPPTTESPKAPDATKPALTAAGLPYDPVYAQRLLAVFAGMALMVTYVETMVLPAFEQFYTFFDLSGTAAIGTVAWILSAYLLVGTVVVPIFGKLGDLYGKKRMLLIAMSIYAVAVTLAGFTPNIGAAFGVSRPNQIYFLIGMRGVQGIGMGMFPLAFSMIPEAMPAAQVGKGQGIVSAMFAAGAALGLAGGGWIAQTYGWQFTYHTVVPLAITVVILAYFLARESPHQVRRVLDIPGAAALGSGLALLLVGITEAADWGWTSWSAASWGSLVWGVPEFLVLSVVAFALFIVREQRTANPMIQFSSLRPRNIFVSNLNGVLVGSLMFFSFTSVVILSELSIGPGLGVTEFTFGLLALPSAISMLATGPFVGQAVSRVGPKPITLVGYLIMALGGTLLLLFHTTPLDLAVGMVPLMAGNVCVLIAMSNLIVLSVDRKELGVQTGMNQTFRNLGTAVAPVITTSVLASFTATFLVTTTVHGVPVQVPVVAYDITGFQVLFGIVIALALLGFLLSLTLKNYRFLADGSRTGHVEGAAAEPSSPGGAPTRDVASHPGRAEAASPAE